VSLPDRGIRRPGAGGADCHSRNCSKSIGLSTKALLYFKGDQLLAKGRPTRKPDTFVFLGFTHYLAKTRRGMLNIERKPSVKARERFIRTVRTWLMRNRHLNVRDQRAHLDKMLNGFYQYFGLRLCCTPLYGVRQRVRRSWAWALKRRSQKAKRRCDWATLSAQPWFQLPVPRVTKEWV
jgi:RNA-directed DNA polymerase